MKWLIYLYIIPGLIVTWLFPKFVEYQGGMDSINMIINDKHHFEDDTDLTLTQCTACLSFIPIFNIFVAFSLIYWFICIPRS